MKSSPRSPKMTMLLSNHHDLQYPRGHHRQTHSLNYWTTSSSTTPSMIELISTTMPQSQDQDHQQQQQESPLAKHSSSATHDDSRVAQALEIARDSPEGCQDPAINFILETALAQTWFKIQTQPNTYVMSRAEFAVFNFFQHRFVGNKLAIASRKRYWDNVACP
ncbi:hypothetical protein SLS62_007534 [Diatrype stigma]|uniref:Uncharacterized protein n=1 Tax=Diatrype stigma TaxID=117547 RepID=A0AAN9YM89_9PEZI